MNGKDKCRILKQIRREIAEKNDIEWVVSECKHQGNCKGTCPKCEAEVRKLESELSLRRRLGKAVAIVGVSSLCTASLTACSLSDIPDAFSSLIGQLTGKPPIEDIAGYIDTMPTTEPETIELDGEIASFDDQEPYELEGDIAEPEETDHYELDGDVPAR